MQVLPPAFLFQSTLPHGSDGTVSGGHCILSVSIHAPSRERRRLHVKGAHMGDVSIHAPSQERRPTIVLQKTITDGFNPRSLTGATVTTATSLKLMLFQSTLPRGSDKLKLPCTMLPIVFQSTLPRGSDLFQNGVENPFYFNFNPRSLAGATLPLFPLITTLEFQSTLPCGSDDTLSQYSTTKQTISIHAPLRERLRSKRRLEL